MFKLNINHYDCHQQSYQSSKLSNIEIFKTALGPCFIAPRDLMVIGTRALLYNTERPHGHRHSGLIS